MIRIFFIFLLAWLFLWTAIYLYNKKLNKNWGFFTVFGFSFLSTIGSGVLYFIWAYILIDFFNLLTTFLN